MDMDALTAALVVTRGIHFAAASCAFGALAFDALILRHAVRASLGREAISAQCRRIALACTVLAGLTIPVWVLLLADQISGAALPVLPSLDVLLAVLFQTRFGVLAVIRLALAIGLFAALVDARLQRLTAIRVVAAGGFVATLALAGHAGAGEGAAAELHLAADVLHLLTVALWVGGLPPLIFVLMRSRKPVDPADAAVTPAIVLRFSHVALVCVVLLLASGLVNAWMLVGDLRLLLVTEYGRALLIKLALFALMLVLAGINRLLITPQLLRTDPSAARAALTRSAGCELALGLCIWFVVGAMGLMHPPIHFIELLSPST